jgi:hypothetical protein
MVFFGYRKDIVARCFCSYMFLGVTRFIDIDIRIFIFARLLGDVKGSYMGIVKFQGARM